MRNEFVYSLSIEIHASAFKELLESIFCILLVGGVFPAKSRLGAWRSGSQLVRGEVNMADKAELHSPIHLTSEVLVVGHAVRLGIVTEKNWAHSVDQGCLQVLQFSVHLIDLLSILLRYNGLALIHSGPPNSDHHIFWMQVRLWEMLWSFFSIQPWNWLLIVI